MFLAMHYRHVVWDWNGTLLNDAWLCRDVMNNLLTSRNRPPLSESKYQAIFDFPIENYYKRAGFDFNHETFEELGAEWMVEYDQRRIECDMQEHGREILESVRQRDCAQYILSAYHHTALVQVLEQYNILDYFESVTGLDDIYANGKVAQGLKLMKENDIPVEEAVLIGDTLHDAEVAEAMGIDCILVPSGNQSYEKLVTSGAQIVDSLAHLYAQWQPPDL